MGIKEVVTLKAESIIGQVLTQIDASIPSEQQCNAAKSIVKKIMWKSFNELIMELENGKTTEEK